MAKMIYEETTTHTDHETGEQRTTSKRKKFEVIKEPNYIKLYLRDLCKLNDIPKSGNDTLNELLLLADYQNEIVLNSAVKGRICFTLGIKKPSLDNNISRLTKEGIIKRIDRGIYILNPNLFGRGDYQDIKKLRIEWEYSDKGRELKKVETDTHEQTTMDFEPKEDIKEVA